MKNLKGGRPKLADSEKRIHAFTVRFTESELAELQESCGSFPTREYIRNAALKKRMPTGTKKTDPALLNELRRIGANLNQLTRYSHKNGELLKGEIWETLRKIKTLIADGK